MEPWNTPPVTKRTPRSKRPAWLAKTATASDIVSIIRDVLDADQEIEPSILRIVADCMAGAFDFTDEEQAAFVKRAMANHEGDDDRSLTQK